MPRLPEPTELGVRVVLGVVRVVLGVNVLRGEVVPWNEELPPGLVPVVRVLLSRGVVGVTLRLPPK